MKHREHSLTCSLAKINVNNGAATAAAFNSFPHPVCHSQLIAVLVPHRTGRNFGRDRRKQDEQAEGCVDLGPRANRFIEIEDR